MLLSITPTLAENGVGLTGAETEIIQGLEALRDFGHDLDGFGNLALEIPVVNQALGPALDIGSILQSELVDRANDYFGDTSESANRWAVLRTCSAV